MRLRNILIMIGLIMGLTLPGSLPAASRQAVVTQSALGTNLAGLVDWSDDLPLVDLFKLSRSWIPQCAQNSDPGCTNGWDTGESAAIDVDANGWVRALPAAADGHVFTFVSTVMLLGDERLNFAGQYIVLYDGEGTLTYGLGASKDNGLSAPGRDVINVTSGGFILLSIRATNPSNYIRNIRVVRAADESSYATQVFSQVFLDRLQPFGTLRFMDWMRTNDSPQATWGGRPALSDARYTTDDGAPLELMIALANRTNTNPWFNMPHMADNNYVTQFATMVKAQLHSDARVYVEYSNETWNGQFTQAQYVNQQGMAAFGSSNAFQSGLNWHGRRIAEICDIWKQVWGAQAGRVQCVAAAQAANSWTSGQVLDCPLWTAGAPCADHGIDALAIAPYFGGYLGNSSTASTVAGWSLNQLFQEISSGGVLPSGPSGGAIANSTNWMAANASVAASHNVRMVAYEGGQHLVGNGGAENNQTLTDLLIAANRDARMEAQYTQYLDNWRASGGKEFMNFSFVGGYSKWGSWGALEYINQPDTPKWTALTTWGANNPCWWEGCTTIATHRILAPLVRR